MVKNENERINSFFIETAILKRNLQGHKKITMVFIDFYFRKETNAYVDFAKRIGMLHAIDMQ